MLDILAITGPIYVTIGLGFVTTRLGLFTRADLQVLGKFVVNVSLPALLFNALAQRSLGEVMNGSYLLAYAAGSLAVLSLGRWWARRVMRKNATASAYVGMGISCSNSGFVGYPIAMLTLGPVAGVALALNMLVENLLMLPLAMALAERGEGTAGKWHRVLADSLVKLLRNPMIIALIAGFGFAMGGLHLPEPVARTVNLFAMTSGAMSLFVIGGTLVGLRVKGLRREVAQIAFGKLLLHPLGVLCALLVLPLLGVPAIDPALRTAAVLMAAMPMMSIFPILAQRHGHDAFAAAALLGTTVASFFTISGLLWGLKHWPLWGG